MVERQGADAQTTTSAALDSGSSESASLATTPIDQTATTPIDQTATTPIDQAATTASATGSSTGDVAPYDPSVLPVVGGETADSASWPTWRRAMGRWEWKSLPGTDISAAEPDPIPAGSSGPSARIDAWNGLAADTRTNRLYSAANGGHTDYSGNEVVQIDLSSDAPRWTILRAPTAPEDVRYSVASQGLYYDYYADGRPTASHSYYALHFLGTRNAIFRFGAGAMYGTGPEMNWKTDSFSLTNNDWSPAGTWPDVLPNSRGPVWGASICLNPGDDSVFISAPDGLRRFDPATGAYTLLMPRPDLYDSVVRRPCAVDAARQRVVYFGDNGRLPAGGMLFDLVSKTFSQFSFKGDAVSEMAGSVDNFVWYEPKIGRFVLKPRTGDHVLSIDPVTFEVTRVVTTGGALLPNAANGVHTRWQRMPKLGGYAYYAKAGNGVWFLAIE